MNAYRLKPVNFPWPPLLYAIAVVAALLLGNLFRLSLPARNLQMAAGVALLILAVLLDLWALKTLFSARTTVMPNRSASRLVTDGPYRFTRNPVYLGYTASTIAFGLILGNPWFLIAAFAAAVVTSQIVIRREEMHLLARFGIEYERYCRRTRRWL
ncbi:isoprenylcysteine carboxylmethyltransferase family protein [Pseudomonas sp. R2.Fl]|nr:isoprenylcysteine carboxylmethyltransferase family protein [Pseudomonas sp. R2.Fl]